MAKKRTNTADDRKGGLALASRELFERLPSDFPDEEALRETWIAWVPPEDAEAFRLFLGRAAGGYHESGNVNWPMFAGSGIRGHLRCVARDIRYVASYLAFAAHDTAGKGLTEKERSLVRFADTMALEMAAVADDMDARVRGRK